MENKETTAVVTAESKEGVKIGLKEDKSLTVNYPFPTNVAEATKAWGEDVCLSKINAAATIDLQGVVRRQIIAGKTKAQAEGYIANVNLDHKDREPQAWIPGLAPERKSKVEKFSELYDKMSPEEKAKALAEIQG